ncbi:hypothetical protein TrVE_jg8962 [Triparma verrucosa]|uniref:DNA ligase n=1 Tax=Triparma verrucosa TaxID=1606542 RepID=A0A9W7DLV9_9STRA|nr:hypothetical protein TrVE_jg8962 [Triparma verrucosa]
MSKAQPSLFNFFGAGAAKKKSPFAATEPPKPKRKQEKENENTPSSSPTKKQKPAAKPAEDADVDFTNSKKVSGKKSRVIVDSDSEDDAPAPAPALMEVVKKNSPSVSLSPKSELKLESAKDKLKAKVNANKTSDVQSAKDKLKVNANKTSDPQSAKDKVNAKKEEEKKKDDDEEFKGDDESETDESDVEEEEEEEDSSEKDKKDSQKAFTSKFKSAKSAPSASSTKSGGVVKKSTLLANKMTSNENLITKDNAWETGKGMPFSILTQCLEEIEGISARLEIQQKCCTMFRKLITLCPADLVTTIYLCINAVAPSYECIELGIGDSILQKALVEAAGTTNAAMKAKLKDMGDLGLVAQAVKSKVRTLGFGAKPKPLVVSDVLASYRKVASISGTKSQSVKVGEIKKILNRANGIDSKFIVRGLQGKLRIGLAKSSVLVALAHAFVLTKSAAVQEAEEKLELTEEQIKEYPEASQTLLNPKTPIGERLEAAVIIVKKAYSECSNVDQICDAALVHPLHDLHLHCKLEPGRPVEPMLAKPTKSVQEVLKRLEGQRFTCEYKYDGERVQVHLCPDGSVRCFSRNLLDTTDKFPEAPEFVKEACADTNVTSFVLDAEIVAFDSAKQMLVPFQVLSTRKREMEKGEEAKVKVIVQAFDLMYLNGESLLLKSLSDRRDLLKKHFKVVEDKFRFAVSIDAQEDGDTAAIEEFLDAAIKGQCEGLMVKTLDTNAIYEPTKRSLNWLKLKKDYLEGMGDSVDLVPLGAYFGQGKRTGTYGAYLLGCYDTESEELQSVCKCGTGFSDENLKLLMEGLEDAIEETKPKGYVVASTLEPDVWFKPCQVWEVKAADLSTSSTHKGALGKVAEGRGIGLRFPRFERLRPDKKVEQATSSEQILDMYYNQDSVKDFIQNEGGDDDDNDFEL